MFDVIILFRDNTRITLSNVSHYSWDGLRGVVCVGINENRQFINKDDVKFIGRVQDVGTLENLTCDLDYCPNCGIDLRGNE